MVTLYKGLFASAVLLTLASACSENDGPSPDDTPTVRIGFFRDRNGDGTDAILAVRQINAAGGLALDGVDYDLELIQLPHRETVSGAVDAVQMFVDMGVVAAVGPPWSSLVLGEEPDYSDGAAQAAIDRDLLLVSANATSAAITALDDDDLVWRTIPSDDLQGKVGAQYAYTEDGGRRAAVLRRDDPYGKGLAATFAREFEQLGGEVVANVAYPTEGDLDRAAYPELAEVFADMPDTVYIVAFEEFAQISNRIVQGRYLEPYGDTPPRFMAVDGSYFQFILLNGAPEVLERLAGTVPRPDPESPEFLRYLESIEDERLGDPGDGWPYQYDAVWVIALAIQSAGSTDPSDFKRHLRQVTRDDGDDLRVGVDGWAEARQALLEGRGIDYDGASGPIDFTEQGDPGRARYSIWTVAGNAEDGFEFDESAGVEFPR